MMTSIFSSFDLTMLINNSNIHSLLYSLFPTITFFQLLWVTPPSRWLYIHFLCYISSTLSAPTHSKLLKGSISTTTTIFYLIIVMNMWGAAPYVISMTSHLMITLSLGALMWTSLMSTGMMSKMKTSSAHFLPENTPIPMASFLSMVEGLSSYIRPITLSFRLAANISAGHVILGMMTTASSWSSQTAPLIILPLPLMISGGYLMFELMICFVQAFVFTLLSAMYSSDYILK